MSEANKALETIERTMFAFITENEREDILPFVKKDFKTIRTALTRLSEIEPIIQELVEARKKATQGEWEAGVTAMVKTYCPLTGSMKIADCSNPVRLSVDEMDANAAFITLAANRIAKIGEV